MTVRDLIKDPVGVQLFAVALMGQLSASERFEMLLEERSSASLDEDDPMVLAALGYLAVSKQVRRWALISMEDDSEIATIEEQSQGSLLR